MTRLAAHAALLLLLAGCAEEQTPPMPPTASFDAIEGGCDGARACVNADVTERVVQGVRVVHRMLPGAPIVSVRVLLDGGASRWTPARAHGEALLFRMISWWGSATRPGASFDDAVARIGGRFSANSGLDFANVSIVAPVEQFDAALSLVADAATAPPIPDTEEALEHVKSVYASGLEARYEEPASAASQTAWDMVYGAHPYNMQLENVDAIEGVGFAEVEDAAEQLLHEGRVTLVVVGDVVLERVLAAVERRSWVRGRDGDFDALAAPVPSERRAEVLDFPDAPNWHVRGYFVAPAPQDDDYLPLLLGLSVLDNRLFDELRTERGLVYTAGAGLGDYRANHGRLWLSTVHPGEALLAFHDVLGAIQQDGPMAEELEAARAQYLTAFYSSNDTASGLSWTLGNWLLTTGERELADSHVEALEEVSIEQVTQALGQYLPGLRLAAAGAGEPLTEAMLLDTPSP